MKIRVCYGPTRICHVSKKSQNVHINLPLSPDSLFCPKPTLCRSCKVQPSDILTANMPHRSNSCPSKPDYPNR
ncbi:hypothetical protein TorRG33x02_153360 [Trema orientale]|uniref:Uncharacterized protein n=1 Tax=Trema orientale TaxID=63057 RepID=A0A2P5ETD0_TREOI|nr:hypothetical protein TorRG33x02_153360 [Trema orientale]